KPPLSCLNARSVDCAGRRGPRLPLTRSPVVELRYSGNNLRKETMAFTVHSHPTPLRVDEHGVVRVGDSQVLLDIVIREYNNGAEPEAIAHGYPTLDLADVYGVIAYYLRHRKEIDDYLDARRQEADTLRQEIEAKQASRVELRAKLQARKAQIAVGR